MQVDHLVGKAARLAEVVRGHDDLRAGGVERADDVLDLVGGARIEARRRLVEEQHLRMQGPRARQRKALLLAAREHPRGPVLQVRKPDLLQRLFGDANPWKGKVFDAEKGELRNKISPFGFLAIRARVYTDSSWLDGRPTIVIDYSKTSLVARWRYDTVSSSRGSVDWDKSYDAIRALLLQRFAEIHSLALQQTLHGMGTSVLEQHEMGEGANVYPVTEAGQLLGAVPRGPERDDHRAAERLGRRDLRSLQHGAARAAHLAAGAHPADAQARRGLQPDERWRFSKCLQAGGAADDRQYPASFGNLNAPRVRRVAVVRDERGREPGHGMSRMPAPMRQALNHLQP